MHNWVFFSFQVPVRMIVRPTMVTWSDHFAGFGWGHCVRTCCIPHHIQIQTTHPAVNSHVILSYMLVLMGSHLATGNSPIMKVHHDQFLAQIHAYLVELVVHGHLAMRAHIQTVGGVLIVISGFDRIWIAQVHRESTHTCVSRVWAHSECIRLCEKWRTMTMCNRLHSPRTPE